ESEIAGAKAHQQPADDVDRQRAYRKVRAKEAKCGEIDEMARARADRAPQRHEDQVDHGVGLAPKRRCLKLHGKASGRQISPAAPKAAPAARKMKGCRRVRVSTAAVTNVSAAATT